MSSCKSSSGCGCQTKSQGCSSHCSDHHHGQSCGSHGGGHGSCHEGGDHGHGCSKSGKFLELADHAWMEVLKEKIKEQIKSQAKNMDELAKLIAETNHQRWQKKVEDKQCCGTFEEKLKEIYHKSYLAKK